ncbi:MAG TPA: TauD/TfdA family dioxygenase [Burkholderiales bacterium]|nr:TauD/TfdA family dioxygenase [Burkholderiales bacterium]
MPGPFDLLDERAYRRWRDEKLSCYPDRIEIVELGNPRNLNTSEREALLASCARANLAIYRSPVTDEDKSIPRLLGLQLGLEHLENGISSITPEGGARGEFIPYTDRPIGWHTDGYYNPASRRIRAMTLHCVRAALEGGESALLDHELAYILLRDEDPEIVRALWAPDAMTIPPRLEGEALARPAEIGPVFSAESPAGSLHMRYTARGVNIVWKDDAATRAVRVALERILRESPYVLRLRLEPGMGIVCNNVLHARTAFRDAPQHRRLLYRARYYDRVAARGHIEDCASLNQ